MARWVCRLLWVVVVACVAASSLVMASQPVSAAAVVLDPVWGGAGFVPVAEGQVVAAGLSGRVFLVGGAEGGVTVRRLNDQADADAAWGGDGEVFVSLGSPVGWASPGAVLGLQTGGVLFVAFTSDGPRLVRLLGDGSLDAGFGSLGVAPIVLPDVSAGVSPSVFVGPGGEIVLSGKRFTCGSTGCSYTGYVGVVSATGELDSSFGGDGWVEVAGYSADVLGVRSDGRILVLERSSSSEAQYRVERLMPDGDVDSAFASLQFPFGTRVLFRSSIGRLIAVQESEDDGGNLTNVLSFFTSDGVVDPDRPVQTLVGTGAASPLGDLDLEVGPSGSVYFGSPDPGVGGVAAAGVVVVG